MEINPLRPDLAKYLQKHGLTKSFSKQVSLLSQNPQHPSLHTEMLEPKSLKIYSFRLSKKYRVIFVLPIANQAEIIDINDHYQ